jgi:hypothetical protein
MTPEGYTFRRFYARKMTLFFALWDVFTVNMNVNRPKIATETAALRLYNQRVSALRAFGDI